MKKFKALSVLALFVLSIFAVAIPAYAEVPLEITDVLVNGKSVFAFTDEDGDTKKIFLDDKLEIEVDLRGTEKDTKLSVEATLRGTKYSDSDITNLFTLGAGQHTTAKLALDVSKKIQPGVYALVIRLDNDKNVQTSTYYLAIEPSTERVDIVDVLFSPSYEVKAGYTLITNVKLRNYGEYSQRDVKVTVSMPELAKAATASAYLDIKSEESKTTEDLWFRIPADAKNGEYDVVISVLDEDGEELVSETRKIEVVGGESAAETGKTVVAFSQEAQTITAGGDAVVYPLTISNTGSVSKTYTVSANVGDWGTAVVSPNMFVLQSGETKIVYVSVAASKDANAGAQVFGLTISADGKSEQLTMNANIAEGKSGLKSGLEIALIVLVVILIIVALVVGFSRLKKSDDEEEQTYY